MAKKKPANKKNQTKKSADTGKSKQAEKSKAVAEVAVPAGGAAFFLGLMGTLSVACLFMPWYNAQNTIIYGYQAMTAFDTLPATIQAGFQRVDGPIFISLMIATSTLAVALGFSWPKLTGRAKEYAVHVGMVLSVAALIEGMILLLVMLNMKAKPSVESTGIGAAVVLGLVGVAGLFFTRAIDNDQGRTESALTNADWAIWIGALAGTTMIHYRYICYGLVQKAPEALLSKLRVFK